MTLDDLKARQAAAIAYEGGPTVGAFGKRRPVRWMDAVMFRCTRGHVCKGGKLDVGGILCHTCSSPAVLTFPEDSECN